MSFINIQPYLQSGKQFSVSIAAWFLEAFNDPGKWDQNLLEQFRQGIAHACIQFHEQILQKASPMGRKDPRIDQISATLPNKETYLIYTDYDVAQEIPITVDCLAYTSNRDEADFVLSALQVRNFLTLPIHQRICQFPYEGALIRKDLLLLTVRKYCFDNGQPPAWWLPTYDLRTEFHLFAEEYKLRIKNSMPNRWIFKPAQGTRALGHRIIDRVSLQHAAFASPLMPDELVLEIAGVRKKSELSEKLGVNAEYIPPYDNSDRVAQLFAAHPLLINHRKFDLRFFVLVRSFVPFEAYVHDLFYARLANKPYSLAHIDDMEVALTVSAYDENEEIAKLQERVFHTELQEKLDDQYGVGTIDVEGMRQKSIEGLRKLFHGAAQEIGEWPNSSAYYSVDIIYEGPEDDGVKGFVPQMKVLEVNFMGDWHGVEAAVRDDRDKYIEWVNDLYLILAHPTMVPPRVTKL